MEEITYHAGKHYEFIIFPIEGASHHCTEQQTYWRSSVTLASVTFVNKTSGLTKGLVIEFVRECLQISPRQLANTKAKS